MNSFDFYDTLVTRLVATPIAIFRIIEARLGIEGFARARQLAERSANRASRNREITLEQIYRHLPYEPEVVQRAKALELELERHATVPVRENVERVREGDYVLSDMYLPVDVIRQVLQETVPSGMQLNLLVSSTSGMRKADGTVWRSLTANPATQISLHLGDNHHSDVRQPLAHGVRAELYEGASLNAYERRLAAVNMDGDVIAGVSRATRLSWKGARAHRALCEPFASVIAPLLVSFVDYVLEDCRRRSLPHVLFLARDGQLLYRIAEKLVRSSHRFAASIRYVHSSRNSLHVPGYVEPRRAAAWLLEGTRNLTLAEVARRGGMEVDVLLDACRPFQIDSASKVLSAQDRRRVAAVLSEPRVANALEQASAARWPATYAYYREAGLSPGSAAALVDVGWTGRMQSSLRATLDKAGGAPVALTGYYLCLSEKVRVSEHDELSGYLYDAERDKGEAPFDPFRPVIEATLLADHATTVSFEMKNERPHPVLGRESAPAISSLIRSQQDVVLHFVDLLLRAEGLLGRRVTWPRFTIRDNLLSMLQRPTRADALAYRQHALSVEQIEGAEAPLVRDDVAMRDLFDFQRLGMWPEGSLAASAKPWLLGLLAMARRLNSFKKAIRPSARAAMEPEAAVSAVLGSAKRGQARP